MLTSIPVKGEEAHDLGLVDALVSPDELVSTTRWWALDILERRRPWVASLHKTDKIEPLGEAREILKFARAQVWRQAPNLQHPLVCIDVVEEGIVSGGQAGLWKEAQEFQELLRADNCKSLVNIFFAQRGTSKVRQIFRTYLNVLRWCENPLGGRCMLRGFRLHKCPYLVRPSITISDHNGVLFSTKDHPRTKGLSVDRYNVKIDERRMFKTRLNKLIC